MKKSLQVLLLSLLFFTGCKKAVENAVENAIIKSMTDGQWVITSFIENGTDITTDFSGYKFQYHNNKTVDAIKNGIIEKTGNWDGDPANKTTWADFPGAVQPVILLNGTWQITNNTLTYVKASQTIGAETKTFRLDKQ
ncbi:MAG: hypothetical protein JWM28_3634 [Chitinophagaceae bacterium]|nr:hypothetical protein [Chitinophagaceae bacterium]